MIHLVLDIIHINLVCYCFSANNGEHAKEDGPRSPLSFCFSYWRMLKAMLSSRDLTLTIWLLTTYRLTLPLRWEGEHTELTAELIVSTCYHILGNYVHLKFSPFPSISKVLIASVILQSRTSPWKSLHKGLEIFSHWVKRHVMYLWRKQYNQASKQWNGCTSIKKQVRSS